MTEYPIAQKKIEYDITPGLGSQKVISAWVKPAVGTIDIRVPVPFKGYLAEVQAIVGEACSQSSIDIEKTEAGGTQIMEALAIPESSAIGTRVAVSESTSLTNVQKHLLVIDNDYLNMEVSSSATGTKAGSFMVYFMFESADALVV